MKKAGSSSGGIRVGIVGTGNFAKHFIPLFKAHPEVAQVVLCDLDATKLKEASKEFGISVHDMISDSRKQAIVRSRQIAIFLSRRYTEQTIQSIGTNFNRYHATVIHSINAVEKEIKAKGPMQKQVAIIEGKLTSGNF